MQLAKPALDIGLYTNRIDEMLEFWQQDVGLPFSELLPVGGGVHQHRHAIGASVLKINHARDGVPAGQPTGIRRLTLFDEHTSSERTLEDPDGNRVTLMPEAGPRNLTLSITTNRLERSMDFYTRALGLPGDGEGVDVGHSRIVFDEGAVGAFDRTGIGFRYLTLQVYDVNAAHAAVLAAGGNEGMAPVTLGQVARISFVTDPDGNWIELSQRRSITGSLDPAD